MQIIQIQDGMKNSRVYDGNTLKFGVSINGTDYIVKYSKSEDMSVYSEYIASNIIRKLGIPCHEVFLGRYGNDTVNVIKDFTSGITLSLHSFKDTKQSSEDTNISTKEYTYLDVLYLLEQHLKMPNNFKYEAKCRFWDMFICDAILANRDRHWGNWGYLNNRGIYRFAPLYDNGACLFPNVNMVIQEYATGDREEFLKQRIFIFPASLFKQEKEGKYKRTNFYEMFSDLRVNKIFASRVKALKSTFSIDDIFNIVYNVVKNISIPTIYKRFYIEIVYLRYVCIILRKDFSKEYDIIERRLEKIYG